MQKLIWNAHALAGVFFTTYESAKVFYANTLPSGVPQPVVHSLASGTAELASCVVLTPAEVVKQNAQMLRARTRRGDNSGSGSSGSSSHVGGRSTSLEVLRMLWRDGGGSGPVRRLLTGYTVLAARNLPFTAIQFPVFEFMRGWIWDWRDRRRRGRQTSPNGSRAMPEGFGSGGDGGEHNSGMVQSRARLDGEVLQERVQANRSNAGAAASAMLLETGLVTGVSAALSGAFAAVVTTPTDVVKTRMMLSTGREEGKGLGTRRPGSGEGGEGGGGGGGGSGEGQKRRTQGQPRRISGFQVAGQIWRERGIKGLFRGGTFRAAWTALGSGLYLGTYEVAKLWLKGGGGGRDDGL